MSPCQQYYNHVSNTTTMSAILQGDISTALPTYLHTYLRYSQFSLYRWFASGANILRRSSCAGSDLTRRLAVAGESPPCKTKDCLNGGTVDTATCECKCSGDYKGSSCESKFARSPPEYHVRTHICLMAELLYMYNFEVDRIPCDFLFCVIIMKILLHFANYCCYR